MNFKFYTDTDIEIYNPTINEICDYISENYKKEDFFAVLDKQPNEGLDWIQCGTIIEGETLVIMLEVNRGINSDDTLRASSDVEIEDVLQAFAEFMDGTFTKSNSSLYKRLNFIDFMSRIHDEKYEWYKNSIESNSACYVVTATFDDINHPVVCDFRIFRDDYLRKSMLGRLFIKIYYSIGPYLARVIQSSSIIRIVNYNLILKPLHKLIKHYK